MRSDPKWITTLHLEPAHPSAQFKHHYTTLSNNDDSRSRSCVPFNAVREESYSILDIINVFAPSHHVEMDDDELFPSKARSQRWGLPRKATRLDAALWRHTECLTRTVDDEQPHNQADERLLDDEPLTKQQDARISVHSGVRADDVLDDLWFCAGQTLQTQTAPRCSRSKHNHHSSPLTNGADADDEGAADVAAECIEYKHILDANIAPKHASKDAIISAIIDHLISVPFADYVDADDKGRQHKEAESLLAEGVATRSSSVGSLVDIAENQAMTERETSVSYTVNDQFITPPPPTDAEPDAECKQMEAKNTSELYEFLFDGVDTDTDDDDIFPPTTIDVDYLKWTQPNRNDANANRDVKRKNVTTTKANRCTYAVPEGYVPCRPLWEL